MSIHNGVCVESCPSDYFKDEKTQKCMKCDSHCDSCENSKTECT